MESLAIRSGSANSMWYSCPSAEGRRCTENCGGNWARCCASWRSRKRVGSKKGTCCPITIPPKYEVSQVVRLIKGKSAIHLARVDGE